NARHDGRAPSEIAAIHEFIQTRDSCRSSCRRVEGAGKITARPPRRLYSTIHFDALTIDDAERMPPHLKILSARLDNLDRPNCCARHSLHSQTNDGVGDGLFGKRRGTVFAEGACFKGENRGEVFALQSFDEDMKGLAGLGSAVATDNACHAIHE